MERFDSYVQFSNGETFLRIERIGDGTCSVVHYHRLVGRLSPVAISVARRRILSSSLTAALGLLTGGAAFLQSRFSSSDAAHRPRGCRQ